MGDKGKYLGIDFGDRRCGIALSDLNKEIVFPRDAMEFKNQTDLLAKVKALCAEEGVTKVVIGLPIGMDGTFGERAQKTYAFSDKLKKTLGAIPVELFDERLTTKQSKGLLREGGITAKEQKKLKDSVSAQLILEGYLGSIKK